MFKIGQEVVFIRNTNRTSKLRPQYTKFPRNYQTVVISAKCCEHKDSYDLKGFEFDYAGLPQSFHYSHLRPLSDVLAEISLTELMEEPTRA